MMALVAVLFGYASGFLAYEIGHISARTRIRTQQLLSSMNSINYDA